MGKRLVLVGLPHRVSLSHRDTYTRHVRDLESEFGCSEKLSEAEDIC